MDDYRAAHSPFLQPLRLCAFALNYDRERDTSARGRDFHFAVF